VGAVIALAEALSLGHRRDALYRLVNSAKADTLSIQRLRQLLDECALAEKQNHQLRPLPLASLACNLLDDLPTENIVAPELSSSQSVMVDEWVHGWGRALELCAHNIAPPGPLLLHGPPGTGKSTLANSLPEKIKRRGARLDAHRIIDSHLGVTGTNLQSAFKAIRESSSVAILEEIDALGNARRDTQVSADAESNRIVTALLRLFDDNTIPLVATTNRIDMIDAALLRRFEFRIEMPEPSLSIKFNILRQFLPELGSLPEAVAKRSLAELVPLARRAQRRAFPDGCHVDEMSVLCNCRLPKALL
jgi:AAA+ superfamily predicted ATPase